MVFKTQVTEEPEQQFLLKLSIDEHTTDKAQSELTQDTEDPKQKTKERRSRSNRKGVTPKSNVQKTNTTTEVRQM